MRKIEGWQLCMRGAGRASKQKEGVNRTIEMDCRGVFRKQAELCGVWCAVGTLMPTHGGF